MPAHSLEPILAELPIFEGFSKAHLELLTGCASNVVFKDGENLFREGQEAKQFFVVRAGKVALGIYLPGHGIIPIQTVEAGDVVGWSWLFPPYRWHFTGQAMGQTRLLSLDGECLRKKCEDDHGLGYEFLKRFSGVLVQRLNATRLQLMDMYHKP